MFFDSESDIVALASNTNFSIIAISPKLAEDLLEKAYKSRVIFLRPEEKNGKISVENVRDFTAMTNVADKSDRFFVVLNAEAMNEPAQNAFLKNLEEPKPHHHFVLITPTPSALLPTILSRAQVFYQKSTGILSRPVEASDKVKQLAKQLIVATPSQLVSLATDISKHKDNPRGFALEIVGAAIEITYKSYFATGHEKFLKKLPSLLTLYDSLSRNGHVKLHIVADMI